VTRVTADDRDGDDGGNGVKIHCDECPAKLHSYWDGIGGDAEGGLKGALQRAWELAPKLPKASAVLAQRLDENVWIEESFDAARATVYQPPIGPGAGPFTLDKTYQQDAVTLAHARIALAGARLGNVLNAQLK
jgi:hypothetical protein